MAVAARGQPYGIDARTTNTSLVIHDIPLEDPGAMQVARVFPRIAFEWPLLLGEIPDGSGRLFVVERAWGTQVFPNAPDPDPAQVSTLLDISAHVESTQSEQGLLGAAFDPGYAANGRLYVYYSHEDGVPPPDIGPERVSRFTSANPAGNFIDPASEEVLLSMDDLFPNHNGGMIEFGPDNYLYIGTGDGGSAEDPYNRAQNPGDLLGKFLRIDVRSPPQPPLAYAIPPDNPFAADPDGSPRRKEVYALGMRNPWRWSFDRLSGLLYCADVGQDAWEEIDVIEKGKNYGWRVMEGAGCNGYYGACDPSPFAPPILQYDHTVGQSITGGFVSFGSGAPALYGAFVYGDYASRKIWALRYDGAGATTNTEIVGDAGFNIAGFGQDASGEVYVLNFSASGGVYVLRPAVAGATSDFPLKLSDIPALLAAGLGQDQTALGIIPYAPSAKLWSDGARKERFLAIPGAGTLGYRTSGGWDFPEESVVVKNFLLDLDATAPGSQLRRVETRLLFRKGGVWRGYSYEWNDAQTDAQLLDSGKSRDFAVHLAPGFDALQTWAFPSREQCNACHTAASHGVLGLNTAQMNADFLYPASGARDNQLRTLDHIGLFAGRLPAPPVSLPKMPDPADASATSRDRARAYLHANCAMCHQPGGTAPTSLDLRWEADDAAMNAIGAPPAEGDLGVAGAEVVKAGDPAGSVLYLRMSRRGQGQMPPLATSLVDPLGDAVGRDWILSLNLSPNAAGDWASYE